jgi:hypothetical protein
MPVRRIAPVLIAALVIACQPQVELAGPVAGELGGARRALVQTAEEGAVPLVILGQWPGLPREERDAFVSEALASGVRGVDVTFAPAGEGSAAAERLVVSLGRQHVSAPERLCQELLTGGAATPGGTGLAVAAAYCRADEALDAVGGTLADAGFRAQQRLLWRTSAALFPDDYAETYGFDLLPDWLGVEAGGSVGF